MQIQEKKQYLLKRIPNYMIPSYFVQLEKMPCTINGKIDYELWGDAPTESEVTPSTLTIGAGTTLNGNLVVDSNMATYAPEKVVINGGTFTKDPAKYVPYGYASVDNEDGTWTVKKAVTSEEELKDAIENGDGEIVLGDDIFLGGGGIIIP